MDKRVSLSRAAKMAGVRRAELQARIQRGELQAFDGMVRMAELLEHYPDIRFEDERILERMEANKAAAMARDLTARALPDAKVLLQRLALLDEQLQRARDLAQHYAHVVEVLDHELQTYETGSDLGGRQIARNLRLSIQRVLHKARESVDDGSTSSGPGLWMHVMAPVVRLEPGGDAFAVEGDDTVLEAALRAGLSIPYGCSNGACGQCRARVLSGEARYVRSHDLVLSEVERSQGFALMCSVAPVTDLVIELGVARSPEQIGFQTTQAVIRGVEAQGEHVVILRVQTPRTRSLRFLAGQHVRVHSASQTQPVLLSLANCPCDARNLLFHVDTRREDLVASGFLNALQKGTSLELEGPFGHFVIETEVREGLVFIALDTGFAPVKSLIEHLIAQDAGERIELIWIASGPGHYADNLCRSWEDAFDGFHYRPLRVASRESGALRMVLREGLHRLRVTGPDCRYFVAGQASFVEDVGEILQSLGVGSGRVETQSIPPEDRRPTPEPLEDLPVEVVRSQPVRATLATSRPSDRTDRVGQVFPGQILGRAMPMAKAMHEVLNPWAAGQERDPEFPYAPSGWNREEARILAQEHGLDALRDEHWELIRVLQELFGTRFEERRPAFRVLQRALEERYADRGGRRYLYQVLPAGPVALGCRLAGLEPPSAASDPGFGHVS
jgi:CDP-4-dehydro-6-deoxyglucose reductase